MATLTPQDDSSLPSLLVFGPHTDIPADEVLVSLRRELLHNPSLTPLRGALRDIQGFWQTLVTFDSELKIIDGLASLVDLQRWVEGGGVFPHRSSTSPSVCSLPATFILQIAQYTRYLTWLGRSDSHETVLRAAQAGGVQGFCIGLLSAVTVSAAGNSAEIGAIASVSLRLAVCIGAYVDLQAYSAEKAGPSSCISIRWPCDHPNGRQKVESLVGSFPHAYVASITDDSCVTVTARTVDIANLTSRLQAQNMRVRDVSVRGWFHTASHQANVGKLLKFASKFIGLDYPPAQKLKVVVRSPADGGAVISGSLILAILENILSKTADWYAAISVALDRISDGHRTVLIAGFETGILPSLMQNSNLNVLSLNTVDWMQTRSFSNPDFPPHAIAIVGMAGRFPGADSLAELWDLLARGEVMVERAPLQRLGLSSSEDNTDKQWWGNFLRYPDAFDHKFFKKTSREALACDPQQRVLLEVVYQALESSGYFRPTSELQPEDYGCYIGAATSSYYDNVACHPPTAYATVGTSRPFFSGSVSHHFGWTGPSLTIDTACSSSLVAINAACRAILSGECSRAIAGGTNVITSPFDYQNLQAAGFLSPTGQCKPFDAAADGYCRAEGVAAVVLKPLADALKENDDIKGVIMGSATSQNQSLSHITVPQSESQKKLYHQVMKLSNIQAQDISYVEAHGTGTTVGDPVEYCSIRDAFAGPSRDDKLYFSSIKGNIGHTEATAGIAGLLKTLLMMEHGQIPPQASFNCLSSKIPALPSDRMEIPQSLLAWQAARRIACVNSYGAAGSNAAIIVAQKPQLTSPMKLREISSTYPLFVSAASADSLRMSGQKLVDWLGRYRSRKNRNNLVSDLTFNLADQANHALPHIFTSIVTDLKDVEQKLSSLASGTSTAKVANPRPVVLVFGGQESEFVGLSMSFYHSSSLFRLHLDNCNQILLSAGLESLYPAIFQQTAIADLVTLHSALFAIQYASAKAWMDCGLIISGVVGHSFGQLTALCVTGVLSLQDTLKLITNRAKIILKHWGGDTGSMIFLQTDRQGADEIVQSIKVKGKAYHAEVACHNGPRNHIVAGPTKIIDDLENLVRTDAQASMSMKRLEVRYGYHSVLTEPLLPHLRELAKSLIWNDPHIHLETCSEGQTIARPDHNMVTEHTRQPVFFQQAVERLARRYPQSTWLEAGRGSSVIQLVKSSLNGSEGHVLLSPRLTSENAQQSLTDTTVDLWKAGHSVQYWLFHRVQKFDYQTLSLPPYQFEKTSHWLPFLIRPVGGTETSKTIQQARFNQDFLSFLGFVNDNKLDASFRISSSSDRFKTLVSGHVVAGQSIAPASFYLEIVARAVLKLQSDPDALEYVPTMKNLTMISPIGLDNTQDIILTLRRKAMSALSWTFSITTLLSSRSAKVTNVPSEQSTGTVHLLKRNDVEVAQSFHRFEFLTGDRRYHEVMTHPDVERMSGKHLYHAFSHVVSYGEAYRSVRELACVNHEAVGRIVVTPGSGDSCVQHLCDTPMIDSLLQTVGFLVNYFNNPSREDVFVCHEISRIQLGGTFTPDAKEWLVYSTMTNGENGQISADAYVFEAKSKKMVMTAFGLGFAKTSQSLLARLLKGVEKSGSSIALAKEVITTAIAEKPLTLLSKPAPTSASTSASKRLDLYEILHNVTDVPLEDLSDESTFEELGVDSLGATEILNDIRTNFGLNVDLSSFLFFPNIGAIVAYINQQLGIIDPDASISDTCSTSNYAVTSSSPDTSIDSQSLPPTDDEESIVSLHEDVSKSQARPLIISAFKSFEEVKLKYDEVAIELKAAQFWSDVYPDQARLVRAYVLEAFRTLDCDLQGLQLGEHLPNLDTRCLPRHRQLLRQLCLALEEGDLIRSTANGFVRTTVPIDATSAETIYTMMTDRHPQHDTVHQLIKIVGSRLAQCLKGQEDGLQLVFGNKQSKRLLEALYRDWPLNRTLTLLLSDFLEKACSSSAGGGKFRVLEIGSGTGGTTRRVVDHLRNHGITFEYVFTDISPSLVAAARRKFKDVEGMSFEVLDVERPPAEYLGAFHFIISTNCIHATRDLERSLTRCREMLRSDGVLTLIEVTKNMFWLDIVFGLFEGWWLFDDGRTHALVDEKHWDRAMRAAGFEDVLWTQGKLPESRTIRLIAAFASASPSISTSTAIRTTNETIVQPIVYKKVGDQEIHADVYCPANTDPCGRKLPIALMIHGGSHVLFSRKDVRPPQTRLLLERGFLPVSLDHRLCPEVRLGEGPMIDVRDALKWARYELPAMARDRFGLNVDGDRVVAIGWSSGGHLAMSLGWTAPQIGVRPPEAILAFYCPTDYEDKWWRSPIQPIGAEDRGDTYDVLEAVQNQPITNYSLVGAWEPLSDPRIRTDPRCRIVLHMNWKAQMLPVIIGGLPSKDVAGKSKAKDWNALPQPLLEEIIPVSPRAQIARGNYRTPTFLIHGTNDDLIPWEQSRDTYAALREHGVEAGLCLVEGGAHICDLSTDPRSDSWKAVLEGYGFIASYVL